MGKINELRYGYQYRRMPEKRWYLIVFRPDEVERLKGEGGLDIHVAPRT
ncbi:MAG: hypothetical protein FGF48_03670 [Candidatus Brockarchaeota archaeon]|nr:hypothetical protein [Candidatus Brockarchaeota archaeon]